jgi:hypothetical protein
VVDRSRTPFSAMCFAMKTHRHYLTLIFLLSYVIAILYSTRVSTCPATYLIDACGTLAEDS